MGGANQCVRFKIYRETEGNIFLDQEFYIGQILNVFGMESTLSNRGWD